MLRVPNQTVLKIRIEGTGRRVNEGVIDHNVRDKKPNLFKHSEECNDVCVVLSDFEITGNNFRN